MQTDARDEHAEKAESPMHESRAPGAKVTVDRESHAEKQ
jgi:hypothetical protein